MTALAYWLEKAQEARADRKAWLLQGCLEKYEWSYDHEDGGEATVRDYTLRLDAPIGRQTRISLDDVFGSLAGMRVRLTLEVLDG